MTITEWLAQCTGFDWDEGNLDKNRERHHVAFWEAEEIFFNQPFLVLPDERHSAREPRFYGLGQTDAGRWLFVAFTIRGQLIRVISVRDMNRAEKREYGHHAEEESNPETR